MLVPRFLFFPGLICWNRPIRRKGVLDGGWHKLQTTVGDSAYRGGQKRLDLARPFNAKVQLFCGSLFPKMNNREVVESSQKLSLETHIWSELFEC
jgi:hypothetical protein